MAPWKAERAAASGASRQSDSPEDEKGVQSLLGDRAYRRLRDLLLTHEGFNLDAYRSTYLARRVQARLSALRLDPAAYVARVAEDPAERRSLMETLGVNVSAFFRDAPVWTFLEEEAIEGLVRDLDGGTPVLQAASLGCAGGQEPYTLAMLLKEVTRGRRLDFHVDAFDVDPHALAVAQAARYPPEALDELSDAALDRYFTPTPDGGFEVMAPLRDRVSVRRLDFLTEPIPGPYHLILCRNMMIYLSPDAKERLLHHIHAALVPHGLFVMGQSEMPTGSAARFFRALSSRYRVYRREDA